MASIADLERMTSKTLSEKILAERELPEQTYAIVDVRDKGLSPFNFILIVSMY